MAIGILVISLLLGSILVPLSAQVEQRKITETHRALEEMREALLGFVIAHGHLPCPDKTTSAGVGTANDGLEDVNVTACVSNEGNLPWGTLGTPSMDSWGNRYRYRIHGTFAQRGPPILGFTTISTIDVCADSGCAARLTNSTDGPPAVILSHGRNGLGAVNSMTNSVNPTPTSADELENADGDVRFVSRVQSSAGSVAGEFDDIVLWMPRTVLLNRMVAAGRLP